MVLDMASVILPDNIQQLAMVGEAAGMYGVAIHSVPRVVQQGWDLQSYE